MKLLVTYAGSSGPAAGVADRIARVMTGLGAEVTLLPMSEVTTVKGFTAVIAGSLEQAGGWMPGAIDFVRKNQVALNRKPFAVFTIIPSLATDKGAESHMVVMQYTAHVRGMVHTISEGFFSGEPGKREDPKPGERSKFKLRILLSLLREGENRSQTEIETWTAKLHEKLIRETSNGAKGPVHGL